MSLHFDADGNCTVTDDETGYTLFIEATEDFAARDKAIKGFLKSKPLFSRMLENVARVFSPH